MPIPHYDAQTTELKLPALLNQLPIFLEQVRQHAECARLTTAQSTRLELAVEEALVNVFHYAYVDEEHTGSVTCRLTVDADGLSVEIMDKGLPFDPLAQTAPNTTLTLEQRPPGGLGIFMIRELTDEVSYHREHGYNVLTLRTDR